MSRSAEICVVILKTDRLYGELIRRQIWDVWPNAVVQVFQRGLDALAAMQDSKTDLFVVGAKIDDMDGLEHLEPFIDGTLPILIVTSRADARFFEMLPDVRYTGLFDGQTEGLEHLPAAFRQVIQGKSYISPALLPFLHERRNNTLEPLTEREQVMLALLGDGTDNKQASKCLGISQWTVLSHRERIMRKLDLHHSRQLMHYALANGYVVISSRGVRRPGFQRRLASLIAQNASRAENGKREGGRQRGGSSEENFDS